MKHIILLTALLFISCSHSASNDPVIRADAGYFEAVEQNDIKLSAPREGEWLFGHKEAGQTFAQYKGQRPALLTRSRHIIYLLPVGTFDTLQRKALALTREYLSIYFQTGTVLLKTRNDRLIPGNCRRTREDNHIQLLAPYIMDTLLTGRMPDDGIALMAFTSKDLYPGADWNFVFGLSSYQHRVGVSSVYRLQDSTLDSTNFVRCLGRLLHISSHEIGHMLSMRHCTFAACVMNGTNSIQETDRVPNRLCSECQKKLYWNIRYDNRKRLKELCSFFKRNNLPDDYRYLSEDLAGLR